jgi:hypothetical protein
MGTGLLDRVVSRLGGGGGESRLARAAVAGAAISVAPLRFLTQRVSAPTVICSGQTCGSGACCCDVYTVFCCQLVGGSNAGCPANTAIKGWWRCDCYAGSGLCSNMPGPKYRYYMDCTRTSGTCACQCGRGSCAYRHTCCNTTGYNQCRPSISGKVICRLVTCVIPSSISCTGCGSVLLKNNATCVDDAPCLGGPSCYGPAC